MTNDNEQARPSVEGDPGPFQYRFDLDLRATENRRRAALWALVTSYAPFLDEEPLLDGLAEHDDDDGIFNQLAFADLAGDGWAQGAGRAARVSRRRAERRTEQGATRRRRRADGVCRARIVAVPRGGGRMGARGRGRRRGRRRG